MDSLTVLASTFILISMERKLIYINALAENMTYNFGLISVSKHSFH